MHNQYTYNVMLRLNFSHTPALMVAIFWEERHVEEHHILTNAEARYSSWEDDTSGTMRQGEKWRNLWFVYGEVRGDWPPQTFVFRPIVFRCLGLHPIGGGCGKHWSAPASGNSLHTSTPLWIRRCLTDVHIFVNTKWTLNKTYRKSVKKLTLAHWWTKVNDHFT